jgi:hypothetical protein
MRRTPGARPPWSPRSARWRPGCSGHRRRHRDKWAPKGEWRTYGGDLASTCHSALDQINAGNFNKLEVAWRFKTDNLGARTNNLQATRLWSTASCIPWAARAAR